MLWKLRYYEPLSNGAFKFNLRRYSMAEPTHPHAAATVEEVCGPGGRGLHSSTCWLNLSRFGHTSPSPVV